METERRFNQGALELRAAEDGGSAGVSGYAIVFDQLSDVLGAGLFGGFRERIAPTAMDGVDMTRTVALFNHDSSKVLGSAGAGTLRLQRDERGLRFDLDLPDTSYAADMYKMIQRGDISGASFGFTIAKDGDSWAEGEGGVPVRSVTAIEELPEVSVGVVFPAYPQSSSVIARCKGFVDEMQRIDAAIDWQRRADRIKVLGA